MLHNSEMTILAFFNKSVIIAFTTRTKISLGLDLDEKFLNRIYNNTNDCSNNILKHFTATFTTATATTTATTQRLKEFIGT